MEKIIRLIKEGRIYEARSFLNGENAVDIAEFFHELEDIDMIVLFRILPKDKAAEVFSYMHPVDRQYLVEKLSDEEFAQVFEKLCVDDAVDFIEELPANVVKRVLRNLPDDRSKTINTLLNYPEDSVGSIMTTEYVDIKEGLTVGEAIEHIRAVGMDRETINTIYVTDNDRVLTGILEIRQLILSPPDTLISDLTDIKYMFLATTEDREEAANTFTKYGFLAMPVVDGEHRLVGIVTVDDILGVINEEHEEDFAKMNALAPGERPYLEEGVFTLAKRRIFWLLFLMISATFTGMIIRKYEVVLSSVVVLASFIPMLMDTGGNAGSQSSTLIIRGLALHELSPRDFGKVMWKELRISLLVGTTLAAVNFARLYFIDKVDTSVCFTVCGSLIIIVVMAKVVGGLLPIIAKQMRLDPAIMAGPLITTIVDAVSLIVYFNFAVRLVDMH